MLKLKVLNIRLNGMLIGFFNIKSLFLKDQEQNFFVYMYFAFQDEYVISVVY